MPNGYLQKTQDVVLVFREEKCGLKYVMHTRSKTDKTKVVVRGRTFLASVLSNVLSSVFNKM